MRVQIVDNVKENKEMNYKDVLRATEKTWKSEARRHMEAGADFVVINLGEQDFKDCIALAQEFDYTCIFEDRGEDREILLNNYPAVLPKQLGFTHRSKVPP